MKIEVWRERGITTWGFRPINKWFYKIKLHFELLITSNNNDSFSGSFSSSSLFLYGPWFPGLCHPIQTHDLAENDGLDTLLAWSVLHTQAWDPQRKFFQFEICNFCVYFWKWNVSILRLRLSLRELPINGIIYFRISICYNRTSLINFLKTPY